MKVSLKFEITKSQSNVDKNMSNVAAQWWLNLGPRYTQDQQIKESIFGCTEMVASMQTKFAIRKLFWNKIIHG